MNKKQLAMLEKAFEVEIENALSQSSLPPIMQTKSKVAAELVASGHLQEVEHMLGGGFPVVIRGYMLTELGRLAYCVSCDGADF